LRPAEAFLVAERVAVFAEARLAGALRVAVLRPAVFLLAVFFAGALRATVFFAADFLAVVFFVAVFFVADFLAADFFVAVFFVAVFLAPDFTPDFLAADRAVDLAAVLAPDFLAAVFLAVAFLAVVFFAVVFFAPVEPRRALLFLAVDFLVLVAPVSPVNSIVSGFDFSSIGIAASFKGLRVQPSRLQGNVVIPSGFRLTESVESSSRTISVDTSRALCGELTLPRGDVATSRAVPMRLLERLRRVQRTHR